MFKIELNNKMKDAHTYLMQCDENELFQTWWSMGQVTVNKDTKFYAKDSVVRVDASDGDWLSKSPLHNNFIYVAHNYVVDNVSRFPIDWSIMQIDDITGQYTAIEGIMVPFFVVLPAKWRANFMPDKNFIPFNNHQITIDNGCINIDDDELETILTAIGFPFVTFADNELAKNEIIKYCIKPAMQRYFTFRPIIEEQSGIQVSRGAEFMVPYPIDAYACVPYYTVPGSGAGFGGNSGSPFAFYNEQMMMGGMHAGGIGGGRFGRGVRYRGKQVPGFVGLEWRNTVVDALAANQGFLNFFRREKCSRKKIDGKLYAYGFSTIGGNLNFKWLKASRNWDDIKFEDLETIARPMARVEVLNNFAMIRSLVKQDIAGQLDPTVLQNRADKLEEQVQGIIKSIGITGQLAIMRGGGN